MRVFVYQPAKSGALLVMLKGTAGDGMRAPRIRSIQQDQGMPHDRQGYDRSGFASIFV